MTTEQQRQQRIEAMEGLQALLDEEEKGNMGGSKDGISVVLESALRGIESSQRWLGITPGWTGKDEE